MYLISLHAKSFPHTAGTKLLSHHCMKQFGRPVPGDFEEWDYVYHSEKVCKLYQKIVLQANVVFHSQDVLMHACAWRILLLDH